MSRSKLKEEIIGWIIIGNYGFYAGPFKIRNEAREYKRLKTCNNPNYRIVRGRKTIITIFDWESSNKKRGKNK